MRVSILKSNLNAPFAMASLKTRCINLSSSCTSIRVVINFMPLSKSVCFKRSVYKYLLRRESYRLTRLIGQELRLVIMQDRHWRSLMRPRYAIVCEKEANN